MNFTKFVEQEKIKARIKNIEELRKNIDTPETKPRFTIMPFYLAV